MKIFKKVYNPIKKLFMPPTRTVREINDYLNGLVPGETWQPFDGVQALTTVTRQPPNDVNFNIGSGVLIKGFVNRTTGEIKLFPARLFDYPRIDI